MSSVNGKRVLMGALAGAVVWSVWTGIVTMGILNPAYHAEQSLGHLLAKSRYGAGIFFFSWALTVLLVSGTGAWIYAVMRGSRGAGPRTALKIGLVLGFAAGFPVDLSILTWLPVTPIVPLFWMVDIWGGVILATLVAAFLYKDNKQLLVET